MHTTELQKYIIKRQFIKGIKLKNNAISTSMKTPEFISNNVEFEFNVIPQSETNIFMDAFIQKFDTNAVTLAKYVVQDVSTEQIMSGKIPKFTDIELTPEFLQWQFPAIQEIVEAYLNDTVIFWNEKSQFNVMLMFENKMFGE